MGGEAGEDVVTTDTERPDECQCCGFKTPALKVYDMHSRHGPLWLCRVCASTSAGNVCFYPDQYDNASTLKTIAYCTNLILGAIATMKEAPVRQQETP